MSPEPPVTNATFPLRSMASPVPTSGNAQQPSIRFDVVRHGGRRHRNTNLDDKWIVRIGQAWHRIRAAEIPLPCRAEEFGRRSAHDCAEIMDQVRLVSKAAGVCDLCPAKAALPRSDDLFDPRQSRILFRAGAECCTEAARELALADVQCRGELS